MSEAEVNLRDAIERSYSTYVAARSLGGCKKDFEPGMEAVFLRDDADEKAVTASAPLLSSATARYIQGYGCLLDRWEGQRRNRRAPALFS